MKEKVMSESAESKTNIDSKKVKEMIALGAAYALNCKPCMEVHKRIALKEGLTQEEMLLAIQVAEGVKSGASKKTKGFAGELFGKVEEEECCEEGSECCP